MKRVPWWIWPVVLVVWLGCRGDDAAPPPQPAAMPAPADDATAFTGEGFEIVFHEEGFTGSEFQHPSMVIRAGAVNVSADGEYILEDVNATVFRDGEPNTELMAGRGEVNEETGTARLSDGVIVNAGDMHLELDHIEWQNKAEPPQAVSDAPVRLRRGESELAATGLVLIPSDQSLTLNEVAGQWNSKGTVQ